MSDHDAGMSPGRRRLLGVGIGLLAVAPLAKLTARAVEVRDERDPDRIGGVCDGCETMYAGMPAAMTSTATIAAPGEPGIRLQVRGTLYRPDGRTPAFGVVLYAYHTDADGYYVPPGRRGRGLTRHGRLRGWIRTGADGRYRFDTIRPAPYPARDTPAHIHAVIKEPGKNEYYIDNYVFDDDPLLTANLRRERDDEGGSGIVHSERIGDGLQIRRDIILGANIPNYR